MALGTKSQTLDNKKLVEILNTLGKEIKQEKSNEYKCGYMDGLMDIFNEVHKVINVK